MNKRREIKVSKVMWPYVQIVLDRDHLTYETIKGESNRILLAFDGSSRRYTEVLEDALCEKQRAEGLFDIPVYSYRTLRNREKRDRLLKLNKKRGYYVLKQDYEKVRRHCL